MRPLLPLPAPALPRATAGDGRTLAGAVYRALGVLALAVPALLGAALLTLAAPHSLGAQEAPLVHTWKRIFYGKLDGEVRLLFAGPMERLKPALGDIDGDGDLDLVVGGANGRLFYFRNTGSARKPNWRLLSENVLVQPDPEAPNQSPSVVNVGRNAAPALVDLDGDDDLDLVVGSDSGQLHFYRNEGNRFLPVFRLVTPHLLGQVFGANAAPRFADLNGDAIPDLLLGTGEGEVLLLVNQGTRFSPLFCVGPKPEPPRCLFPPQQVAKVEPQDNAVPYPVDWDGDGDLDLLVGKSDGKLAFYRNIGTARQAAWELAERRFLILDAGGYAAPVFRDVNGDGRPDLILAGDGERVTLYFNRPGNGGAPELWIEEENLLRVARLGRLQSRPHLASGDWDGDGDADLVVGTRGGQLWLYDNLGEKGQLSLRSHRQPLLPTPQRSFAAPVLADIDGDGDLDLLVGDRNGRLEWIENAGTPKAPRWRVAGVSFQNIDVGAFSTPALYDLDGDGDLDLLVGNSLGNVVHFINRGSAKAPAFAAAAINFGGFRVAGSASPAFFPFDPQKPPELVVGDGSGRLRAANRDPSVAMTDPSAYRPQPRPWGGIAARGDSAPHFMDFNGDGRPDLLLGGNDATLSAWQYEGSIEAPKVAVRPPRPSNVIPDSGILPSQGAPAAVGMGESGEGGAPPSSLDPIFVAAKSRLDELKLGRHVRPAFFSPGGKAPTELVVGTADGKLLHFRNEGPPQDPHWAPTGTAFAGYAHGRNPSPFFFDVDGDGDQDLAVGNEKGFVNYFENTGGPGRPAFTHRPGAFNAVRVGNNAVPALGDLDGDGTLDLLVGNLKGELLHYRRTGAGELAFKLVDRRFLDLDVGVNASPTLAPLLGKRPVLLVGSDRGPITVAVPEEKGNQWRVNKTFLEGLEMPPASAPALADLDGDGDLDLYVGSEAGRVHFFRNNALVPPSRGGRSRSAR